MDENVRKRMKMDENIQKRIKHIITDKMDENKYKCMKTYKMKEST